MNTNTTKYSINTKETGISEKQTPDTKGNALTYPIEQLSKLVPQRQKSGTFLMDQRMSRINLACTAC